MKILHIIPSLRKGGAERLVLNICNELQKRDGVEVKLLVLHPENEYEFISKNIDVKLCSSIVVPSISRKNFADISDFEKIISEFNPQIIHSHLFEAEIVSRWHIINGIKYFTHCHDSMKQFRNFNYKTLLNKELLTNYYEKKRLLKQYVKCDNRFIAISNSTAEYFKKNLPKYLSSNIFKLNNAIDFGLFFKTGISTKDLNQINLITTGSLIDKKNHIFLIEVVKILHEKKYKITLEILGDGNNRKILEERINKYNLKEIVFLRGNVQKVEEYLQKSYIYVHAATHEPFGLVLLEAMASGLPVVCLDGKGNRDIIEQGKNGFMIFEQSPELFAQKITELITNKQLYSEMSLYANEYAKKFDIKEYVDNLIELYSL